MKKLTGLAIVLIILGFLSAVIGTTVAITLGYDYEVFFIAGVTTVVVGVMLAFFFSALD